MIPGIDKRQVERQFSRAARTYDDAAAVQHQMSNNLMSLLIDAFTDSPETILDMGCGTGYSLEQLSSKFPQARMTGIDLSHSMLIMARQRNPQATYIQADMECFHSETSFDLVFSNASIQWCDLEAVIQTANQCLNPGGLFVYNSFGPGTHREIARAWNMAQPGKVHHIDFLGESDHLSALEQFDFEMLNHRRQLIAPQFDTTHSLLYSIKQTGATNASLLRDKGLLSREIYARFLEYLGQTSPLKLSYETLSFVVRKPD